ncbi:DrmB family protein [Actinomadura gamaensis]|uniref:DrmB family protein n=1 Tax=Actinomadura gamaensis TaxID=1763541 RepID=A0ABV9UBU4_9ACTN
MSRPYQELRPSQFVVTFGPGSVVETDSGPVVLKSMDTLFTEITRSPQDFEIIDDRLSRLGLDDARIARIPTNAELGLPADRAIYPTTAFPYWALCARHQPHQVLYEVNNGCPECPPAPTWKSKEKAGREAIRFVLACDGGHLDEVNWHRLVHPKGRCSTRHYLWNGGGRALRLVTLECPRCHTTANFGEAYGRPWPCTGRQPELGGRPASGQANCTRAARILQRGSANLRIGELATALTILDMPARLHNVLGDRELLGALRTLRRRGFLNHETFLEEVAEARIAPDAVQYLSQIPWRDVDRALDQLLGVQRADTVSLRDEELDRLRNAATHGAPPVPHPQLGSPPLFEVRKADIRHVPGPQGRLGLRVAPVSRLRMVMVQTGYRRLDPENGLSVTTSFDWNRTKWYPGIELFGEGVFIDLEDGDLPLTGERVAPWQSRYLASPLNSTLHPAHVWWHTLSHRLLWALSVDSGYSSAAIRERIYLKEENGVVTGSGLLLYTVQPGGDGTMGGLVGLANQFDHVLARALEDVDTCSNDPLCEEAPDVGMDGAACYSCLFASETSCEHRNHGLDRLLLSGNLP